MSRPTTYYERTVRAKLTLVPRHTFQEWGRQRLADIFIAAQVMKADIARIQRQTTEVARCHRCRQLRTITLQASGDWLCPRCVVAPKEETA